ncbi:ATP/GTP-binding protein [Arthrobacter sp. zg-Y820]|uniref:TRAFAC clade GTPase domain-containing protein n=1 Tax=unclassified Arthrobacter TaxID=235627 RepID=UPI001E2E8C15|nr:MULTISPECIES: ATP/GTP-binding protein [unclassified Arthrobacter]MCC9195298.1 ATP/GTP-binding protein [Arthrobacter sp. zg-Y820]MDK1278157.1 ATP/GTP-binding protein [Arthrobacter sp. zg.Y820]MDK1361365.1 ATP/GTP-binding protein [Arthrobacter sp. zg-Y1219]WIB10044.1 ATP/GTP-binding protein [Arthrobacter sp. zg-Y820]
MQLSRALEQHIAVFGESGSGKTVMISSFYGAAQEPQYLKKSLFNVVANETGQGNRLHQNYLGMRDSARLPAPTRFSATSYSFSVKPKEAFDAKAVKARPSDALRLVWHDYPGEWFEEDVSGEEEAKRKVDTFKALLGSDVALLLVDSQRLLDHSGEEERYLKSLLSNFRNGLLSLKDDLLDDGKPLVEFPRIWVMALSKSDLLPEMDVFKFRDLLIEKAGDDLAQLREVLAGLVEASDALSVGEDFVLLSSAKFGSDKIEVTERVGLKLILPLAAMLPIERHVRWAEAKQIPRKVAQNLLAGVGPLAAALIGRKGQAPGPIGNLLQHIGPNLVNEAVKLAADKLRGINSEALARQDYLSATLTGFRADLDKAEEDQVLLRSRR